MSLNAICTGCNQKSNRSPLMQLEPTRSRSRSTGSASWGRWGWSRATAACTKYRHYLYEWLGVDKVEMAVMTELLLRGDQTVGELRGRAARMEPIADLAALRPVLDSLKAKGLVISLDARGPRTRRHPRPVQAARVGEPHGPVCPRRGNGFSRCPPPPPRSKTSRSSRPARCVRRPGRRPRPFPRANRRPPRCNAKSPISAPGCPVAERTGRTVAQAAADRGTTPRVERLAGSLTPCRAFSSSTPARAA